MYSVGQEPDVRFTLANERTLLAWIRTGLGFVTAGLAVGALSSYAPHLRQEAHLAAIVLTVCGVLCGFAIVRWARHERAMRLGQPLPSSAVMPVLTITLVIVAALTLSMVL